MEERSLCRHVQQSRRRKDDEHRHGVRSVPQACRDEPQLRRLRDRMARRVRQGQVHQEWQERQLQRGCACSQGRGRELHLPRFPQGQEGSRQVRGVFQRVRPGQFHVAKQAQGHA